MHILRCVQFIRICVKILLPQNADLNLLMLVCGKVKLSETSVTVGEEGQVQCLEISPGFEFQLKYAYDVVFQCVIKPSVNEPRLVSL